jgi:hypothetical protein
MSDSTDEQNEEGLIPVDLEQNRKKLIDLIPQSKREAWNEWLKQFNEREDEA